MESAGDSDAAAQVQRVRAAALAARPEGTPLPYAGGRPVQAGVYWLAAEQYFTSAAQLYGAGDPARGDYCIMRGDAYAALATLCELANGSGVAVEYAGAAAVPAGSGGGANTPAGVALRARLAYLRKQHPVELPAVPIEAADQNPCLGFLDNAVEHADAAEAAFANGNTVAGHYYSGLVDEDLLLLDICEQVIYGPSA